MREPLADDDGGDWPQGPRPGLRAKAVAFFLLLMVVSLSFNAAVIVGVWALLLCILAVAGRASWREVPFPALAGAILAVPLRYLEKAVGRRWRQARDELRAAGED